MHTTVSGSDVDRDNMYFELRRGDCGQKVAEVFYDGETGEFSLTAFRNSLRLAAIEWLIEQSRVNIL